MGFKGGVFKLAGFNEDLKLKLELYDCHTPH